MFFRPNTTLLPLIERAKRGEEGAWHELDAFYRDPVSRWLISQHVQPAQAEELFQDLLIKLHRCLPQYTREKGLFRTWLRKILENMLKDFREANRRRAEKTSALTDEVLESLTSKESMDRLVSELDPVEVIRNSDLWKRAEKLIPPNDLKCYLAVECFGRDVKDVAEEFGRTANAVHQAVYRTRERIKALRDKFAEEADDDPRDLPER
jgi:RNA polymerase sigma-70 factor, ECF subfamily